MHSSGVEEREETPVTPVQGRKRRRDWVWTLGLLECDETTPDGNGGAELKMLGAKASKCMGEPHPIKLDTEMEDAPLEYSTSDDKLGLPMTSNYLEPECINQSIICDDG